MSITGEKGRSPVKIGIPVTDLVAALFSQDRRVALVQAVRVGARMEGGELRLEEGLMGTEPSAQAISDRLRLEMISLTGMVHQTTQVRQ